MMRLFDAKNRESSTRVFENLNGSPVECGKRFCCDNIVRLSHDDSLIRNVHNSINIGQERIHVVRDEQAPRRRVIVLRRGQGGRVRFRAEDRDLRVAHRVGEGRDR